MLIRIHLIVQQIADARPPTNNKTNEDESVNENKKQIEKLRSTLPFTSLTKMKEEDDKLSNFELFSLLVRKTKIYIFNYQHKYLTFWKRLTNQYFLTIPHLILYYFFIH